MSGLWKEAYTELNEAFRAYQEAGNTRAKTCLKYVVVASMLSLSDINPFAAREAKVFSEDAEIMAMGDLRASLEANDLRRFERTLRNKANRIADEPFIMKYIQPLRRRMHEQVRAPKANPNNQSLFVMYCSGPDQYHEAIPSSYACLPGTRTFSDRLRGGGSGGDSDPRRQAGWPHKPAEELPLYGNCLRGGGLPRLVLSA